MNEMRPLPLGRQEFEDWTDRIISGALLPVPPSQQKFVLADMLLHCGPQEDHKEDAFFIKGMRKFAVNQVAVMMRQEIKDQQNAQKAAEGKVAEEEQHKKDLEAKRAELEVEKMSLLAELELLEKRIANPDLPEIDYYHEEVVDE